MALKQDRLLNVEQVRSKLGCSRRHVYNLIDSGNLQALKIGKKYGVRVKLSVLDFFLSKMEKDCNL